MVTPRRDSRPSATGRRAGYVIAVVVNAAIWVVVNVQPGWDSFDFLTADFVVVLPLINLSLVAAMVINAAYVAFDAQWFRRLGQFVLSVIAFAVCWRLLAVYPFHLGVGWDAVVHSAPILALLGSGVAGLVEFVRLVKGR